MWWSKPKEPECVHCWHTDPEEERPVATCEEGKAEKVTPRHCCHCKKESIGIFDGWSSTSWWLNY
jgi:hypothetical protein